MKEVSNYVSCWKKVRRGEYVVARVHSLVCHLRRRCDCDSLWEYEEEQAPLREVEKHVKVEPARQSLLPGWEVQSSQEEVEDEKAD